MSEPSPTTSELHEAIERVRRNWLTAAALNAAVKPALWTGFAATVAAFLVALAGWPVLWLYVLVLPSLLIGGVFAWRALVRAAARRHVGTPLWVLSLDVHSGAGDALVTGLEHDGPFRHAALAKAARCVTPEAARRSAPAVNRAALAVVVVLMLSPLMFLRLASSDDLPEPPAHVARHTPEHEGATGGSSGGNGGADETANGTENSGGTGEGEGETESGQPGSDPGESPEPLPDQGNGGPQAPPDTEQETVPPGEIEGEPKDLPEAPDKPDFGTDIERVRPEAGDGDTELTERSRWVYNPDGTPERAAGTRSELEHGGELRIPRTKITTSERELIQALHRRMFE
jgi:hypothetical protein